jgi:aminomethyltransferase
MDLRTTPFVDDHRAAGAKLVPFAGFLMPLQYEGIVAEHHAVRRAAGVFDVSHMGEFELRGRGAVGFADRLVTNHVERIEPGRAVYTAMCLEDGGIVDDVLVYRFPDRVLLVVNAANIDSDWEHVRARTPADVEATNRSPEFAQLAVQGPRAAALLGPHLPAGAADLGYYRFLEGRVWDVPMIVSRTGYTGEDGFELYFPAEHAHTVWERLFAAGREHGLAPCGLGARDTLRLEMGFCLYGNDIDRTTNPLEAGLGWTVKFDKPEFVGRAALDRVREKGPARRLAGFEVEGPRVPRHGMEAVVSGQTAGTVTSGGFSPSLGRGIGMAYLPPAAAAEGASFEVRAGSASLPARVVPKPFYTAAHHARPRKVAKEA